MAEAAKVAPVKPKFICWDLIEQVVGICPRVLLWGVSGTGKSWAARKANLKAKVYSVSLTEDTPAAELRGHYGLVKGNYKWLDGPCVMAWRNGTRLCLNELEKASGDAQTFNPNSSAVPASMTACSSNESDRIGLSGLIEAGVNRTSSRWECCSRKPCNSSTGLKPGSPSGRGSTKRGKDITPAQPAWI